MKNSDIIEQFRALESAGLVRLKAEPEESNYFDVYGEPEGFETVEGTQVSAEEEKKQIIRIIDDLGCWVVFSEYFDFSDNKWKLADSIGMCTGYKNPLNPLGNSYVIDLMQSAIDKVPQNGEH